VEHRPALAGDIVSNTPTRTGNDGRTKPLNCAYVEPSDALTAQVLGGSSVVARHVE
jgi:hypothetical protein